MPKKKMAPKSKPKGKSVAKPFSPLSSEPCPRDDEKKKKRKKKR